MPTCCVFLFYDFPTEAPPLNTNTPPSSCPKEFIPVATTRPETILGDAAVCVHPEVQQSLLYYEIDLGRQGWCIFLTGECFRTPESSKFTWVEAELVGCLGFVGVFFTDSTMGVITFSAPPFWGKYVWNFLQASNKQIQVVSRTIIFWWEESQLFSGNLGRWITVPAM